MSTKYLVDPTDPKTVRVVPESYIDDLLTANPKINNFIFPDGNYYLKSVLQITKSGIKILGESKESCKVHIFQKDITKDGLSLKNVMDVQIQYISVHVPHPSKIALSVASANMTKIENCHFYGNNNYFTIYYAGPSFLTEGKETLDAYNASNLDYGNVFRKNVVYSSWSGDSVSFSLQNRSIFTGNVIRGGKVAIYMCKNTFMTSNLLYDSGTNGIHVSLPCYNLQIKYNRIYECDYSGIKITNQLEHGPFVASKYYLLIAYNYIYDSKIYAIEANDIIRGKILNNKFIQTDNFGIYCLRCSDIEIANNKMSYFTNGVWIENSKEININTNVFYSVYPDIAQSLAKIVRSSNNKIYNNECNGQLSGTNISVSSDSTDTFLDNNQFNKWFPYPQECDITK
ncbi:right handed beta helix region protein [Hokovirus HKV1]|uniref:Right handed beta helix region protein n=1 Tax=Hokovirus HKV1 TaxID=1977638 RepID=A0A1V0SGT6_9VIRU|nr:right handed beta helix region protein [Hokovirus HKV1]